LSSSDINLVQVDNESVKNQFINFPYKLFKDEPNWVPPLRFDVRNNLDTKKNPLYDHTKIEMWLAFRDGKVIGRIAGIINKAHNDFHKDKVGFFGFFECINDQKAANMLFDKAAEFCRANGMDTMRGPVNPSTNDECGLLMDAYDQPNVMLMPYNFKYYGDLIEGYGFKKERDLYALWIPSEVINHPIMEKFNRISDMILRREDLVIRKVNMKDFNNEVQRVREVYNDAWADNWGFVPMTEAEFMFIAKNLKMVVDPNFIYFAEKKETGETIGFSLSLPDNNQAIVGMNGKLFPFGIFKFLAQKKKIDRLRVIIMGVKKEYQKKGIDAVFYRDTIVNGNIRGVKGAEISWVLEDNMVMMQTALNMGAHIYKTYRIFDKKL
jgi:hypothetical protein